MKKFEKIAVGASVVSGLTALFTKNPTVRKVAGVTAAVAAIIPLASYGKRHIGKTLQQVNEECDKLEERFEQTGLSEETIDSLPSDSLVEASDPENDEGDVIYAKTLLRAARDKYDDDILTVPYWKDERTLHILQDGRKFVIGIPMPRHQDKGLTGVDMYQFFKDYVLDFAEDTLGIDDSDINIYQKGFEVGIRQSSDTGRPSCYYDELQRISVVNPKTREKSMEGTRDYVKRVNSILRTWDNNEAKREEWVLDAKNNGEILEGYIQYLFFDFPVYSDNKALLSGMTVTNAMLLINELMGQLEITDRNGTEISFEFDHLVFHPESDLEDVIYWNDDLKQIEQNNLMDAMN